MLPPSGRAFKAPASERTGGALSPPAGGFQNPGHTHISGQMVLRGAPRGMLGGAGGQEQGRHLPQPVRSAPRCRPGPTGRPTAWPCPIPSEGGGKCPSGAVWPRPRLAGQNEDTPGPPPRPPPAPRPPPRVRTSVTRFPPPAPRFKGRPSRGTRRAEEKRPSLPHYFGKSAVRGAEGSRPG